MQGRGSAVIERLEEVLRLGWTVRRKSLESFLLPMATSGDGVIVCSDGSLVSLFEVEGSRSMVGSEELDRFVEVLHRRLNSSLLTRGHALHVVFERAVDEGESEVRRLAGPFFCRDRELSAGVELLSSRSVAPP